MPEDDLDRLARILGRLDPDRREQVQAALEHVALDELADQEQAKLPGSPARIEPDPVEVVNHPALAHVDPETATMLTGFLPEVTVKITPTRIDWWVGPRGYR